MDWSMPQIAPAKRLKLVVQIATSYVGNSYIAAEQLPLLIATIDAGLASVTQPVTAPETPQPAISPRLSVTPEYLVCLEDGKKLQMLKRHLRIFHNMTPE